MRKKNVKKKVAKKKKKVKKTFKNIFTTETVRSVDSFDFDVFVNDIYKIDAYRFIATEECGNDSSHTFSPDGKIDEYELNEIEEFVKSGGTTLYITSIIFNDLVAKGKIPAGNYCVNVCW